MPDNDICTRNKSRNIKTKQMRLSYWKIVGKTKIDQIRSQQIRVSKLLMWVGGKEKKRMGWTLNKNGCWEIS